MKRSIILMMMLALIPLPAFAQNPGDSGDVIVIFRRNLSAAERDAIVGQAGATSRRHFGIARASAAHAATAAARQALERHPDVLQVVPDRPMHAHVKPGAGAPPPSPAQVVPTGVQRIGAPNPTFKGAGVGVAILDTGLDFNHQDLQPLGASCFTVFASCQDDDGHGTHVGGIVAARDNTIDVVGVAPLATLYAAKVLDNSGTGTDSTIMAGLEWVHDHAAVLSPPIRIVNMSLGRAGTLDDNPALHGAIQTVSAAGITVVVSAGNDPNRTVSQQIPAAYPEVIAVASTTALAGTSACRFAGAIAADTASYFTTDGAGVAVSAPGEDRENIAKACAISSVGILSTRLGGGTTRLSGTSMSAPHVSGVAALLWEELGTVDPATARSKLQSGAAAAGTAPLDSPSGAYSFDGVREGIVSVPGALAAP
jgi:subtilisin